MQTNKHIYIKEINIYLHITWVSTFATNDNGWGTNRVVVICHVRPTNGGHGIEGL
jgi:hypothetical protein